MKTAGKTFLSIVLLLGLLLLITYIAYRYLLPRWIPILFYLYLAIGVGIYAFGILRTISEIRNPKTFKDEFVDSLRKVTRKSDLLARLDRLRDGVALVAREMASAIAWPIDGLFGLTLGLANLKKKLGLRDIALRQALTLLEHFRSLFGLAVVLALFALESRGIDLGKYGVIILSITVLSVTLRHIRYLVETIALPAYLRRLSSRPYLTFLLIIGADFSTLVVALTGLGRSKRLSGVTFADLHATASQLLQAQEPLKVLKGLKLTWHQAVVGVVGLLFYLALFKTLTAFREFKRKDEDFVWLAGAANQLGNFATALRYLGELKSWTPEARVAEMVALVGVNQLEKAEWKTRLFLEEAHKDTSLEAIFTNISSALALSPLPEEVQSGVFLRAREQNVRDAFVQDATGLGLSPSLQQSLLEIFSASKDIYPLTVARLAFVTGDLKLAAEILNQAKSSLPLDEIIRLCLLLAIAISNPKTTDSEDTKSFHDWAALNLPQARLLLKALNKPIELLLAFGQIMGVLALARKYGPERVEELTFLADSLKIGIQDEDTLRGLKVIELRFEKATASPS